MFHADIERGSQVTEQEEKRVELEKRISEYKQLRVSQDRFQSYADECEVKRNELFADILGIEDELKKYDRKLESYFSYLGI